MHTALITGANRGLGRGTAQALAQRGFRIVLGVRDAAAGREVLAQLPAPSIDVTHLVLELDVGDLASIRAALAVLRRERVHVDVLVNNAGVLHEGSVLAAPESSIDESWDVNVRGPWALIRALLPAMNERGYGRIVNVSSGGGSFGEGSMMLGHTPYMVTKAALNALTVATNDVVRGDVKVNSVCPGWVRTRMGGEHAPRSLEEGIHGIVLLATLGADGPSGGFFRDGQPIPW